MDSIRPERADPDATAAGTAWGREHLERDIVGWLTTQAPDGRLQASPISFLWDRGTILFYSRPRTAKLRNIAANPRVAFALQADPYADHALIVEGTAAVDPAAPPSDEHPAYAAKYRAPLAHWGLDPAETARSFCVAVRIVPERIRGW